MNIKKLQDCQFLLVDKIEATGLRYSVVDSPSKNNNGIINSNQDSRLPVSDWVRVILSTETKKDSAIIKEIFDFAKNELGVDFDLTFRTKETIFELDWSFKEKK